MAGFKGRILGINLSTGAVGTGKIEDDVVRKFIGGSGLGASYS